MPFRIAFAGFLALATFAAAAADPWPAETLATVQTLQAKALKDDGAWEFVESLSREVGPRPAGSENDRKAVAWGVAKLKALGFSNVHAEPVQVPHWVRGELSVRVAGDDRDLAAAALGGSAGTSPAGITADVVMTENLESLRAMPADAITGRIVYFDQHMERSKDGSGYGKAVIVRANGAAEAARRGAVGMLLRTVGTAHDNAPHTGALRYDDIVKKIPAIALGDLDSDALASRLAGGGKVQVKMVVGARDLKPEMSANVVGDIPGETDEIVLLAGHLDSWDLARGSNDDGAGIAIATHAARLIREVVGKPKRTIRVVLYANEEFGTSGGKRYVIEHAKDLDRHVAAMEADFGSGAVWKLSADVPEAHWPVIEGIAAQLSKLGVELGSNGDAGGSDIGPQRALGVPVLTPIQDGTLYFDTHHSANDVPERIDREGLKQNVAVYATAAYLVSQYGPGLGRVPLEPQ